MCLLIKKQDSNCFWSDIYTDMFVCFFKMIAKEWTRYFNESLRMFILDIKAIN